MQNVTITFPDKEEISLLIKEAIRELMPDIARLAASMKDPPVKYMTRAEIAQQYKISLVTLHTHTVNGLPSIKIGKRRLYNPVDVENYFNIRKKLK